MAKTVTSRTYNSETGTWTKNAASTKDSPKNSKKTKNKSANDKSTLSNEDTSKKTSKGAVAKEANKKTIRTLEGTLKVLPTVSTLKLKVGDTIKLSNIGKYLSGKYYITGIERSYDSSSGYSQTITVLKTNFRKTLKIKTSSKDSKKQDSKSKRSVV